MPNIYCPSCGTGNKFLYEKPKVCNSCKFVFAAPIVSAERLKNYEQVKQIKRVVNNQELQIAALRNMKLDIEKIEPTKLGSMIGTDLNSESFQRKKISKEEYKEKVFKSSPVSLDDDQI